MEEKVSLKEFLELKIAYEAIKIDHVRELMDKDGETLKIQAKEYERRLEDLNGEAGHLRQMQQTYMPRELSEAKHNEHTKNISALNNWKNKQEGMQYRAQWIAIAAIILSIFLAILNALKTKLPL